MRDLYHGTVYDIDEIDVTKGNNSGRALMTDG